MRGRRQGLKESIGESMKKNQRQLGSELDGMEEERLREQREELRRGGRRRERKF